MHVGLIGSILIPAVIIAGFLRFKYLDAAVRCLRTNHPTLWKASGEPISYLFNPKNDSLFKVLNKAGYTEWELASQECAWENVDPEIHRLVRLFRYSYWGTQFGLIAVIALAVIWGGFTSEGRAFLEEIGKHYKEKR